MNKTTSTLITILLTAVIVGGGVYFFQKNKIDTLRKEIKTLQEQEEVGEMEEDDEPTVPATSTGLETYTSQELGLSFQYPSDIEEITEDRDKWGPFLLKFGEDTFLSAVSYPYTGPDRGAGWIDAGFSIENQDYINNFCENGLKGFIMENCVILQNSNGIKYAKTLEIEPYEEEISFISYYLFNPDSTEYSGIVISSITLEDNFILNLEEKLDKLVDSINFI